MQITFLKNSLSTFIFPGYLFSSFFCAFLQKVETSLREFEPHTKVEEKFANIQTAFNILSALVLRQRSKWRKNKSEHGEGDTAHPNVRSKSNK